ncbi:MAG: hypothetical protein EHM91_00015 [Planctomycetota bacterium]|nr:MAG: hypothetical protein EHM91_00015 [Planctomycetota bacterium]
MSDQPKRRGRPSLDPAGRPSEPVQVKLSPDDYAAARKVADARRETLQDLMRRALRHDLKIRD